MEKSSPLNVRRDRGQNPGIVAKSVWKPGSPGSSQQTRGMRQAGANRDSIAVMSSILAIQPDQDAGCPRAISGGQYFKAFRVGRRREIAGRQRRTDSGDLGIHFGIQRAIMRIASGTKYAGATVTVIDCGRYRRDLGAGFFQSLD